MRKPFLSFLLIYLGLFLFFQEEIHRFSHHLKEVSHTHSLSCFFSGGVEEKPGITQTCHFHDLFIQNSVLGFNFFSLKNPLLLSMTPAFYTATIYKNFSFFPKLSRGPPKFS